ncbi:F1E22.19 [Arabidopsis thaliana]|nr:uncharacterized protein AT1G65845 [Arabidopsis thaliana]AAF23835.1 F1E22.19 [Arabidopsis thaliana]AAP21146.1 At1g65844 [Arabidopsis thaliana]AEE34431.1 transmembrane protein [Arabidopsis thaliana]BAC41826.1 unknown protein [Arabidopsis thaliana]BAC43690.1 unknown protein [Arabidopsis thaliana]|eukprot:NP_849846.1 transmembrane protein [Arabidopsis thaliana]
MIMKKTTQAYLLLSLVHILLCLSFQIRAIRPLLAEPPSQILNPPPPSPVWPSPPCGTNIGSQVTAVGENSCRQIPRPPKTKKKKIPKPLKTKKKKISKPHAAVP